MEDKRKKSETEELRDKFQSVVDVLDEMIELEKQGKENTEEYEAKAGVLLMRLAKMQV